jgi:small subunit ribosomal protein S16
MGSKKNPFYRVVVAESTSPRDGRFIETIGTYNPTVQPAEIKLDVERAKYWLSVGAQPTDTATYLLRTNGISVRGKVKEPREGGVAQAPAAQ